MRGGFHSMSSSHKVLDLDGAFRSEQVNNPTMIMDCDLVLTRL